MAWVAFAGTYDWGLCLPKSDHNAKCLRKLAKLIDLLTPEALLIEDFRRPGAVPAPRIARLWAGIVALAEERGVEIVIYARGEVRACFASVGAVSRHEIAEAVARHVEMLTHLLPKARKVWEKEHPHMAIFNAAALIVTHSQRTATPYWLSDPMRLDPKDPPASWKCV